MQDILTPTNTKLSRFRSGLKPTSIKFTKECLNDAIGFLENKDFPTTKEESWKYTRLSKLANTTFSGSVSNDEFEISFIHANSYRFVFTNGELTQFTDGFKAVSLNNLAGDQLNQIQLENQLIRFLY